MNNFVALCLTAIVGLVGAFLFQLIHIPVPFLLGPMISVLIFSQMTKWRFYWPKQIKSYSLMVIGYTLGTAFTIDILKNMYTHIPMMAIVTIITFSVSLLFAWLLSKFAKVDFPTSLLSSVPGGLTQMLVLAEDLKGINVTIVTFFHTIRVMLIVVLIPFIVHIPALQGTENYMPTATVGQATTIPIWLLVLIYTIACYIAFRLFKKWHFPAATMLGPIAITIILSVFIGLPTFELPNWFMALCQFVVGTSIGLMLHPEHLTHKKVLMPLGLLSALALIAMSFVMSVWLLPSIEHTTIVTGFLSLAPGGIDQMGIVGHEMNADTSMITMYQVFRMLCVYFFVPPLMTLLVKKYRIAQKNV